MTRVSRSQLCVLIILFLQFSITSAAFADDVVFLDDFEGGTPENWILVLGEWQVVDGEFCAVECSS